VARRLTWPRLWLANTSVMPDAAKSAISASTSRLACGSRLAVGSSSSSTCGCSAQARASASRCSCPPGQVRALRSATPPGRRGQRQQRRLPSPAPAHAAQPQAQRHVGERRGAQQRRAAGTPWPAAARRRAAKRRRWAAAGRAARAAACSCRCRWRRSAPPARRGDAQVHALQRRHRAEAQVHALSCTQPLMRPPFERPTPVGMRQPPAPHSAIKAFSASTTPAAPGPAPAPAAGRPCWSPARWRWSSRA
jgi:hypothetical protein